MTETKWTPGPWNIRHEMPYYLITDVNNCLLSQVCPTYDDKSKYNANLTAAAPDLYAATNWVDSVSASSQFEYVYVRLSVDELNALIDARRKARGE